MWIKSLIIFVAFVNVAYCDICSCDGDDDVIIATHPYCVVPNKYSYTYCKQEDEPSYIKVCVDRKQAKDLNNSNQKHRQQFVARVKGTVIADRSKMEEMRFFNGNSNYKFTIGL